MHFLYRVTAVRKGFEEAPTPEEMAIMGEHVQYHKKFFDEGKIVLLGPCLDRSMGIGIFEVENEEEMAEIMKNDPAFVKGIMHQDVHPFRIGMLRGQQG